MANKNKHIIVASKNPVKILAVQRAFEKMFPEQYFSFEGRNIPSGVADQPMSDKETYTGAFNRAIAAKDTFSEAEYWIGIEGGIEAINTEMIAFAWVVIISKDHMGKARTGTFFLPPRVAELVRSGKELGEADDIVFAQSNSKQQGGAVGLLTHNIIDRTALYINAVIMALIPFKNENLYK